VLLIDGTKLGYTDKNIAKGITPKRCAELILTAASNKQQEAWIAKQPELLITYLVRMSQYMQSKVCSQPQPHAYSLLPPLACIHMLPH
jgi:hypothetical protein